MSYIEFQEVIKEYGTGDTAIRAANGVNFTIEQGEFVVVVGPSGAGKSTILNILGGMDTPTAGQVIVDGDRVSDYDDNALTRYRREDVGFVFQFYNLLPNLTVKENVELANEIVADSKDAQEILQELGLGERLNNFPAQLSGGEQQRVSIARAMAKKPKLLLCDEPTGALDSQTGRKVLALLHSAAKNEGTTVVLITHNAAIKPAGDRVIEVSDGKVAHMYVNESVQSIEEIEW